MARKNDMPLAGREVLLCVSGGIACYKAADLTSKLIQSGAGVTVAMTDSAGKFVAPLTFQALTRRQVYTGMWQGGGEDFSSQHISLTELADLMIIAPATANIIAKIAVGIADELVTALALSSCGECEMLVAPAMNERMWNAPPTLENIRTLKARGVHVIGPETGYLACGSVGKGRMVSPESILAEAARLLRRKAPKRRKG